MDNLFLLGFHHLVQKAGIYDALMREVDDITDELVVHIGTIHEFSSLKDAVFEFFADFSLEQTDVLFDEIAIEIVSDEQYVKTAVRILGEYARGYQQFDPAGILEALCQVFFGDEFRINQEILQ